MACPACYSRSLVLMFKAQRSQKGSLLNWKGKGRVVGCAFSALIVPNVSLSGGLWEATKGSYSQEAEPDACVWARNFLEWLPSEDEMGKTRNLINYRSFSACVAALQELGPRDTTTTYTIEYFSVLLANV
ncbi:hypothetical protein RRG08_018186 [Elysia crispata]|uniref:Uncharacterized protein n=1 Tax=Elysia crispata TaxID=231223 RepID=A0AAE1DQH9_9GAST|nr:hypothetical protein RRG08_018186 [Elysia crispata]